MEAEFSDMMVSVHVQDESVRVVIYAPEAMGNGCQSRELMSLIDIP